MYTLATKRSKPSVLFLPDAPDAEDSLEGLASSQAATHQTLLPDSENFRKKAQI
jgi:hypothetical protein